MFKTLPDAEIAWKDVWLGAAATAFLFTIGKFLIGLYLGKSNISSAYGAVGSVVIILLWIYYSSQLFFFGAELTRMYSNKYGSKIKPSKYALLKTGPPP
jgi:membrane protein